MEDYKQSLIKAREDKKKRHEENAQTWSHQIEWRKSKIDEAKKEPYDPELVWNIETATRKQADAATKKAKTDVMLSVNDTKTQDFYKKRSDERDYDLSEGKRLVQLDNENKDLESQLVSFKKQLFAKEMMDTWAQQSRYKKQMKQIEEEC